MGQYQRNLQWLLLKVERCHKRIIYTLLTSDIYQTGQTGWVLSSVNEMAFSCRCYADTISYAICTHVLSEKHPWKM